MYYTPEMLESRKRVEETRQARLKQELPLLDPTEKVELLETYHPDYQEEIFRKLKVGPSRGEMTPHEFADLFEAYSAIDPYRFDLSQILFITTANQLDTIPLPLLDRMEVMKLSGYILEEKIQIAKKFLIPKQLKEHGLPGDAPSARGRSTFT